MKFKSIASFTALSIAVLLTSCLKSKDDSGLLKDSGSIVVDIPEVAVNNYHQTDQVVSFTTSPPQETITLFNLSAYSPKSKPEADIRVKLTVSPVAGYDALPPGAFNIPTEVVIPKNAGTVAVQVAVNKTLLDLSKNYAATFRIASVSEGVISSLGNEITVYFVIKNPYDADYTVTGFLFHPSTPRALALTKHLSTVGPIRVSGPLGDLGGSNYFFAFDVDASNNLTNYGALGANPPSPQSGFFTADNPGALAYPGPELPGTNPYSHTTYNNKYDPASKTFFMHYGYGVGASNQNGWSRQVYEKWVRK